MGEKTACAVSFGKMGRRFASMTVYMANHAENNDKKWRNRPIIHRQTGAALRSKWRLKRRVIMPLKKALREIAQAILQQVLYYNLL